MMRLRKLGKAPMGRNRLKPIVCRTALAVGLIVGSTLLIGGVLADEAGPDLDRSAAANGDAAALVRLATRYETGDAVPFDLDHASTLLEQAAMRGNATAQYRIGMLQAGDLGHGESLAKAYGWLRLAEKTSPNSDLSEAMLGEAMSDALSSRLDKAEIETAEAWVAAFDPISGPVDLSSLLGEIDPKVELAKLEQDLRSLGCGRPARQDAATGEAKMLAYASAGAVDDAATLADVRDELADHGLALDVADLSPLLCDLRALLSSMPDQMIESGVTLADVAPGAETILREGDRLIVDMAAAARDRYVAVDYVVHTGEVLHLYPTGDDVGRLPANESLRLGDGSGGQQPWAVGPPFGRDLLVVTIGEAASLAGENQRSMTEPLDSYLVDWRTRIEGESADESWQVFERVILTQGR